MELEFIGLIARELEMYENKVIPRWWANGQIECKRNIQKR